MKNPVVLCIVRWTKRKPSAFYLLRTQTIFFLAAYISAWHPRVCVRVRVHVCMHGMAVPPEDSRYMFSSTSLAWLFKARPVPVKNILVFVLPVPWITTVSPFNACSGKLKYPVPRAITWKTLRSLNAVASSSVFVTCRACTFTRMSLNDSSSLSDDCNNSLNYRSTLLYDAAFLWHH